MSMQHLMQQAADIIGQSRRLFVLTGAGMSKESGIPTFREAQEGLWSRQDPMKLATVQGFMANPQLVWEWYQYRFGLVTACQPNPGHYAIAALARRLPRVVVVTQNIDGLHAAAGSQHVVELHGSIHRYKCVYDHTGYTLADLDGQTAIPPRCPRPGCQGMMRPDVVWFGEMLDHETLARAAAESASCDVMLIVGTSGVVQPAASLPYHAWNAGARIIEVNPQPSELTDFAHIFLPGPAGVVLPELLALLGNE